MEWVTVKGGTFEMGDFYEGENEDALPIHSVKVKTFKLSRYETTYAQYDAFARETNRSLPNDDGAGRGNRAVANVSWEDANAFCKYYGYRLPSEAEWEFAARSRGRKQVWSGTDSIHDLSNYAYWMLNGVGYSMPVGLKAPNKLGLYDMSGNVSEWVSTFYEKYPQPNKKPIYKDLSKPGLRIARGGSHHHTDDVLRTYWRAGTLNDISSFSIGFRCAR
jgi:sulfatase modifying factor 1